MNANLGGGPGGGSAAGRGRLSEGMRTVLVCYGLATVGALLLLAGGAGAGGFTPQVEVRVAGYVGVFLVLTTLPIAMALVRGLTRARASVAGTAPELHGMMEAIRSLGEQAALSD